MQTVSDLTVPSNRTILELKLCKVFGVAFLENPSNRTILELKQGRVLELDDEAFCRVMYAADSGKADKRLRQ